MASIKIRGSEYDLLPAFRITLGVLNIVLGIIGVILPVMPGFIFFLIAAALFFPNHRFVAPLMDKVEARLPRFVGWLRRLGVGHVQPEPAPQRIDTSVL